MSKSPASLAELCEFYRTEYRPLYDRFISEGAVAQELHTEIAAGSDHLFCSFHELDGAIPPEEFAKAAAHFKRATFDAFKLIYEKRIRLPYESLMDRKYADVHDGRFHSEITQLWLKARDCACEARKHETLSRKTDETNWSAAFDEWKKILPVADRFTEILLSDYIVRVVKNNRRERIMAIAKAVVLLFLGWAVPAMINHFLK